MAEDNPDDALKVAIREMREGAREAPHKHTSTEIRDTLVEDNKGPIRTAFFRNFQKHGPQKWEEDRDDALRMAKYIGILAVFFAEANHKSKIGQIELQKALELVNAECKNLRNNEGLKDADGTPRDIWCS